MMSNMFTTVILGVGVVFAGLISIIIICKITSAFCMLSQKKSAQKQSMLADTTVPPTKDENRQEIIAAVSAVIAEELGTDISAIRIHSFKKI